MANNVYIKSKQNVNQMSGGYLASIMDTMKKVVTELSEVRLVCRFPDVLPKELSGLPPDREIKFEIELLPGMTPISKAPY